MILNIGSDDITRTKGAAGERLALIYLTRYGYRVVKRNYRKACGEIDIIAQKDGSTIFIEVKSRIVRSNQILSEKPEAAIRHRKKQKIRKTALLYIRENNLNPEGAYRFDVIAILILQDKISIKHIKHAF